MRTEITTETSLPASHIGVSFDTTFTEIRQIVDELTDAALLKEFKDSKILLQKTKPIRFHIEENQVIRYALTVKVSVDRSFGGTSVSGNSHLTIFGSTSLEINKRWELIHLTQIEKIEWHEKPRISLFKVGFSVAAFQSQIENRLKVELPIVIGNVIDEKINLAATIQSFWNVQQSFKSLPSFSLLEVYLQPEELSLTKCQVEGENINVCIREVAKVYVFLGRQQGPTFEKKALNAFSYWNDGNSALNGTLSFFLSLKVLQEMAGEELKSKVIETPYGEVFIENVEVTASKESIRVLVDLSGRVAAKVALRLQLKMENEQLVVHIIDFEMLQANLFFKTLGKLFRKTITNRLRKMVNDTFQHQFKAVLTKLNDSLRQIPINDFLMLQGDLKALNIVQVDHDAENIYLHIFVQGNLFAKLKAPNGTF